MANVVNDRDVLIMGTSPRYSAPTDRGMFITPTSALFKVSADGASASPASYTFQVTLLNMTGAVTFSFSNGMTPTVNGNTVTLSYANMSAVSGTITANITVDGQLYTAIANVAKVADGASGGAGIRGNVDIAAVTSGSVWSDSEAVAALAAAGYGAPQVRDMVTLYKSDRTFGSQKMYNGSAWVAVDYVWNGNVFVKGSILPEAIDTRGLTIKDAQGNIILGSGTGLPASYFAATLGGDNLMNNSGFENVNNSTPNRPNGYIMYNNANVSAAHIYAPGRLGGRAFAIRALATTSDTFGLRTNTGIIESDGTVGGVRGGWQPNKTYVVSFKARKVNGANMTDTSMRWNTAPATITGVSNPLLSTSWQSYAFRITWGASVESTGQLYIDKNLTSGGSVVSGDELHIDELLVQEGDVVSEWFPSAVEAQQRAQNAAITAFTPFKTYDFNGSAQNWGVSSGCTLTVNQDSITVTATNNDPIINTNVTFPGSKYDKIRVRFRRTAGSGWDGTVFYSNANHGESAAYLKNIPDPTIGQINNYVVAEWDMAASLNPSDWASGNVTELRLDLGAATGDSFDIDWIAIGRYGVGSDEAMAALIAIASDSILSKGEKPTVENDWDVIYNESGSLIAQADALGVSRVNYVTKYNALQSYLAGIPGWGDHTTDSAIDPTAFKNNFSAYYTEKTKLLSALAAKAATMASGVTLSSTGGLSGGGTSGQVQMLPVTDGARTVNYAPQDYGVVHVKEFKQCSSIGISTSATYCVLETMKPWIDNSGGSATQWAYVGASEVWKRSGGCGDATWGPWIRDLDRNLYTGDLNATNGAMIGSNLYGQMTASNISTFIAGAAIDLALINRASIGSLSALTAIIGTLRTATSGARTEISDNVIKVFDTSNQMRVRLGDLSL